MVYGQVANGTDEWLIENKRAASRDWSQPCLTNPNIPPSAGDHPSKTLPLSGLNYVLPKFSAQNLKNLVVPPGSNPRSMLLKGLSALLANEK